MSGFHSYLDAACPSVISMEPAPSAGDMRMPVASTTILPFETHGPWPTTEELLDNLAETLVIISEAHPYTLAAPALPTRTTLLSES